jgi:hypothetical protein
MSEMQDKPDHMRGPEWRGWDALRTPAPIKWIRYSTHIEACIAGRLVASLEARPHYCDRGRFKVLCELPDIDHQDCFPRYYMSKEVAISETEAFLRWRLWRQRS